MPLTLKHHPKPELAKYICNSIQVASFLVGDTGLLPVPCVI